METTFHRGCLKFTFFSEPTAMFPVPPALGGVTSPPGQFAASAVLTCALPWAVLSPVSVCRGLSLSSRNFRFLGYFPDFRPLCCDPGTVIPSLSVLRVCVGSWGADPGPPSHAQRARSTAQLHLPLIQQSQPFRAGQLSPQLVLEQCRFPSKKRRVSSSRRCSFLPPPCPQPLATTHQFCTCVSSGHFV